MSRKKSSKFKETLKMKHKDLESSNLNAAAASWIQPDIKTKKFEKTSTTSTRLIDLNDDCLLHLFTFLPVKSQIALTSVASIFANIFEISFKKKQKFFNWNNIEHLTLIEIQTIFEITGEHIRHFCYKASKSNYKTNPFTNFLPRFCKNLISVELEHVYMKDALNYRNYLICFENLKVLKLAECSIDEAACRVLQSCRNLEVLNLSNNADISGKDLNQLKNLKELYLQNCFNILPVYFIQILKSNQLEILDITNCTKINDEAIDCLLSTQKMLKNITLNVSEVYCSKSINVTKLPNLDNITAIFSKPVGDSFYRSILNNKQDILKGFHVRGDELNKYKKSVIYNLKNLEELSLPSQNSFDDEFLQNLGKVSKLRSLDCSISKAITSEALIKFIRNSKTIQKIDLSFCLQFDNNFILDLLEKLKERNENLNLIVGHTSIEPSILTCKEFMTKGKNLTLSFEIFYLTDNYCFQPWDFDEDSDNSLDN